MSAAAPVSENTIGLNVVVTATTIAAIAKPVPASRPTPEVCHSLWPPSSLRVMALEGEYVPSPWQWVRDQVETYERTDGQEANTLMDTGLPIIIVTTRGNKSGTLRKTALMRVERNGEYALVASMGGAPKHPVWYHNLVADPAAVVIQDGPEPFDADVREVSGDERAEWWERAVADYPPYAEYQTKTERLIPVFVARRR